MNFIEGLLKHTLEYESPHSFWKWSAYSTVASVLRDNVFIQDGDSKLFPNLYILFLAGSGARKNRPVNYSEGLVKRCGNTKIISGRSSIQGILDELARTETNAKTGKLLKGGGATFFAPELGAGIVESPEAIKILTDIYDGKSNFTSVLRHSPKFQVDNIVFNAFMASNEEMSKGLFDNVAIYGGLLARTLLIVPDEFRDGNSLLKPDEEREKQREMELASMDVELKEISKLSGRATFDEDAIRVHDSWYKPFRKRYLAKGDRSGIYGRLHTHIKKISVVLAANEKSIIIKGNHMEKAIEDCTGLLQNYNMFIMASGKSTLTEISALVLKDLLVAPDHRLSRKEILWRYHSETDGETLDKAMMTLEGGGIVQSIAGNNGMEWQLTAKSIEKWGGKSKGYVN